MAKWSEKQMAQGGSAAAQPMGLSLGGVVQPHCPHCNCKDGHYSFCPNKPHRDQEERHGDPADHVWVDDLDADNWHSVNVMEGYYPLFCVLNDALNEAQVGKGKERHGNGLSFTEQPALTITRAVGLGFPLGQAMKKIQECQRMDTDAAKRELLGAINYLAAAVLFLDEGAEK